MKRAAVKVGYWAIDALDLVVDFLEFVLGVLIVLVVWLVRRGWVYAAVMVFGWLVLTIVMQD